MILRASLYSSLIYLYTNNVYDKNLHTWGYLSQDSAYMLESLFDKISQSDTNLGA